MHLTTAMSVSKKQFVIAGLPVNIFSERQWTEKSGPVAVMFFLHGRTGTAKGIQWIAEDVVKQVAEHKKGDKNALDLIVVTFVCVLLRVREMVKWLMRKVCSGPAQPWR